MSDAEILAELDRLQSRYVRALGQRDMQAWAACFDNPGSYVCIARENEEQGLGIATMMDDSFERIRDRVKYVTEVWKGTFEDYIPRHVVQRVAWHRESDGIIAAESHVIVAYTTMQGRSGMLATGMYHDRVVLTDEGARFRSKRVVLDTAITPRYLVYPI